MGGEIISESGAGIIRLQEGAIIPELGGGFLRNQHRRSLVNFHSFRRYFITKAEQADQMEHIIAVVVGHKRTGMTLGRYSGGPLLEQARRCVEAVRLP